MMSIAASGAPRGRHDWSNAAPTASSSAALSLVSRLRSPALLARSQLAVVISSFPGRVLGTEARPRKFNRQYMVDVTNEHARRRQAAAGKVPTQWFKGRPRLTDQSWEKMWNSHLHWKRWTQERMGPYF